MTTPRYCVVGAGAAGLGTLQVLLARGFAVDCFERTDRVGGHWHTDYESLHLITSRDVSGFEGHPMPPEYPVYPSREQMLAYIESFADRFDLRRHVTFGTEVLKVEPEGPAGALGWWVETSDGGRTRYDGIVVANGHLWDPNLPDVAADFTGHGVHSGRYRGLDDVKGDRVLVVGAGNSGCDLAVDAANARLDVSISVRRGRVFQPKAIFGRPRAELTWLAKLPPVLQERVSRALVRVVMGPPEVYRGLPEPVTRNLNDQPPVVNNLLPYWIQHGRVTVVPGITRIDGQVVHFTDGTSKEFDTILWATGFRTTLPFLDSALLRWKDGVPLRVAGLTVPVGLERLWFVGLSAPRGPQLPPYGAQARLVARLIRLQELGVPVAHAFDGQQPDSRIDIVKVVWNKQMADTDRVVAALEQKVA
ncbi:NAD(P)/FAD-dependent oxidoreductase [Kineosporia sp. R_H_3]|uniref:flavin-containing monooxygenase n=1 Tax=Kineosporia sp. R_H_3 TaxID=1961848 RepID=UPI000B4AC190|nr:NAD(P)-binding domain-containing protein [Kineosporia sp. R_H_3]